MRPRKRANDASSETASVGSKDSNESSRLSDFSWLSSDSERALSGKLLLSTEAAGNDAVWRTPKLEKENISKASLDGGIHKLKSGRKSIISSSSQALDACLQAICSIPVLRQRLEPYLDAYNREDVISTMVHLSQLIDEGRLKMKEGCAVLTDVALREKAIQVLMNYNLPWLKIGLHVVLGHSALLTNEKLEGLVENQHQDEDQDAEYTLLKLVIEKHFLAHAGLAKYYAANKAIEGLYKPGYHEALGRLILKRFFLLVLTLDKAKCQNTLQSTLGIDGLDGGSPLLFHRNATVKSSRQALQEFLLNAMHGEGDVIGHLGVLGFHVSHVQAALTEYNFEVVNLVEDLQDGVRLCRLAQVMLKDSSILAKIKIPSHHMRRQIHNCSIALRSLGRAGVPLIDEQGCIITADDLVAGEREKAIPLLWNVIVHLQIPILLNAQRLWQEIARIKGTESIELSYSSSTGSLALLDLLLKWAEVICATYGLLVKSFKTSFADARAFCYLINFYSPLLLPCTSIHSSNPSLSQKGLQGCILPGLEEPLPTCQTLREQTSNLSPGNAAIHNFGLVQDAISKLGKIPEVLQPIDFVDGDPSCNERNTIIFLAFLSSHLLGDILLIEEKMAALSWDGGVSAHEIEVVETAEKERSGCREERVILEGRAATLIQCCCKSFLQRQKFVRMKAAVRVVQQKVRSWLARKRLRAATLIQCWCRSFLQRRKFVRIAAAVRVVQRRVRSWLAMKRPEAALREVEDQNSALSIKSSEESRVETAVVLIQAHFRGWLERSKYKSTCYQIGRIQLAWRTHRVRLDFLFKRQACLVIQSFWRRKLAQRRKAEMHSAATRIQAWYRKSSRRWAYLEQRSAAITVQSSYRSYILRKWYKRYRYHAVKVQALLRCKLEQERFCRCRNSARRIQSAFRDWHARREKLRALEKLAHQEKSAIRIQSAWKMFVLKRAAVRIQATYRGWRKRQSYLLQCKQIVQLQAALRGALCRRSLLCQAAAALTVQRYYRGHIARRLHIEPTSEKIVRRHEDHGSAFSDEGGSFTPLNTLQEEDQNDAGEETNPVVEASHHHTLLETRISFTTPHIIRKQDQNDAGEETNPIVEASHHKILLERRINFTPPHIIREEDQNDPGEETNPTVDASQNHLLERRIRFTPPHIIREEDQNDEAKDINPIVEASHHHTLLERRIKMIQDRKSFLRMRKSVLVLQRRWRNLLLNRIRAALTIQCHYRGWIQRKRFLHKKSSITNIQACWRGHVARHNQGQMKQQLSQLRIRMHNTAANVDNRMRLENRLTEALEALLSQKTVSRILHTCATIDIATQHSKLCCERLVAAGAISKLLQLIQTTNRSPPHEQVLKHALSILANIAHYKELAKLVADAPCSIVTIAEQLLRNKEEVLSKAMEVLQLVSRVPSGIDAIRGSPLVLRRLHNLSQALEKKVDVEARNLARLAPTASALRRSAEKKLSEAIAQHRSIVLLLQAATGEDLKARLKAVKRMSCGICQVAGCPLSVRRGPFQDCSNQ